MAAIAMAIAKFGSNVIPWFVASAWFCIRALQSGCVTMSPIFNDISNGLDIRVVDNVYDIQVREMS